MQFDVYRNPSANTSKRVPYILNVQSDLLDSINTRVVVPLFTPEAMDKIVNTLTPEFTVEKQRVVMSTTELATVSARNLGKPVCSLSEHRNQIIAALDLLFTGI